MLGLHTACCHTSFLNDCVSVLGLHTAPWHPRTWMAYPPADSRACADHGQGGRRGGEAAAAPEPPLSTPAATPEEAAQGVQLAGRWCWEDLLRGWLL